MGLPRMDPDGVGCCPPCTPVACSAVVEMACRNTFIEKVICGFPALDGTNRRYAHAAIHWTGTSFKSETAPGTVISNNADLDVTGVFESNTRVVDVHPSIPQQNCTDTFAGGDSCVEIGTDGTLHQIIVYRDATPTYDETAVASCEAGTSYSDVPRNGSWEASFDATDDPPAGEPSFPRCLDPGSGSPPDYTADSLVTATSGTWSRGLTTDETTGGITYHCEFLESLTFTLSDEITYDELAAAVAAVPVESASEGPNTLDCIAQFVRFNDFQDDETIAIQYEPLSVAFFRVSPATGKIRVPFTITTYFPDLETIVDVQELDVVIEDGNDWSSDTLLEPDLYHPFVTDENRLYMQATYTLGAAVPDC